MHIGDKDFRTRRRLPLLLACSALCAGILLTGTNAQAMEAAGSAGDHGISSASAGLSARTAVSFIDGNGEPATLTEPYTAVAGSTAAVTWTDGWYVADGSVEITDTVTVVGDVKLILSDGAQLATKNICVNEGNTFSVYCQGGGTGSLTARSSNNTAAGIGAGRYRNGGDINIYGGIVTAQGGLEGAGIGGGASCGHGGAVRIYGGTVTATGGQRNGAGIGGGGWDQSYTNGPYGGNGADVLICGGTVTATGGGSAPSIGAGGSSNSNGSFSTGEDGSAVIFAGAIRDQSKRNQWSGIVFLGDSGTVYKSQTLTENLTVEAGKTLTVPENTRLTVAEGVTLTVNGTMYDNGIVVRDGTVINNGTICCKVTKNLTNLTATGGSGSVTQGTGYSTTLVPASGYVLPRSVTVTVGDETLIAERGDYSYDPATGVVAIDKDAITGAVTIAAVGATVLDEVSITIERPAGEKPLSTVATCETVGVGSVSLYWTDTEDNPVSGDAHYFPWCYKAHMTIVPGEGYLLTDATRVSVNGDGVEERTLGADGTLRVANPYYSNQARLIAVTQPEDVAGVPNGTEKTPEALGLPSTVGIVTETPSIHSAAVTWDLEHLAEGTYDPAKPEEQAFRVKGVVSVPEEVANPDAVPLEVTVGVTVLGAVPGAHVHDWKVSYEWSGDGKACTATRVCSLDASHRETARAVVTGTVFKAAGCTTAGETLYTAAFAEDWAGEQAKTVADIPALGHRLTATGAKAAGCTEAGNTGYWTCGACGRVFGDEDGTEEVALEDTVIPATGHRYVDGRCAVCGVTPTDGKVVLPQTGGRPGATVLPQTGDGGYLNPLVAATLLASGMTLAVTAGTGRRRCG